MYNVCVCVCIILKLLKRTHEPVRNVSHRNTRMCYIYIYTHIQYADTQTANPHIPRIHKYFLFLFLGWQIHVVEFLFGQTSAYIDYWSACVMSELLDSNLTPVLFARIKDTNFTRSCHEIF